MFGSQMLSNSDTWKVNDDDNDDNGDVKHLDGSKDVHLEFPGWKVIDSKPIKYRLSFFL